MVRHKEACAWLATTLLAALVHTIVGHRSNDEVGAIRVNAASHLQVEASRPESRLTQEEFMKWLKSETSEKMKLNNESRYDNMRLFEVNNERGQAGEGAVRAAEEISKGVLQEMHNLTTAYKGDEDMEDLFQLYLDKVKATMGAKHLLQKEAEKDLEDLKNHFYHMKNWHADYLAQEEAAARAVHETHRVAPNWASEADHLAHPDGFGGPGPRSKGQASTDRIAPGASVTVSARLKQGDVEKFCGGGSECKLEEIRGKIGRITQVEGEGEGAGHEFYTVQLHRKSPQDPITLNQVPRAKLGLTAPDDAATSSEPTA